MNTTLLLQDFSIETPPCDYAITKALLPLYDNFNRKHFEKCPSVPEPFLPLAEVIYGVFSQEFTPEIVATNYQIVCETSKRDVLLGFSGGLDSAYHALELKNKGYNVHLFHFRGLNSYEGNNSYLCALEFANKMGLELIEACFKRKSSFKMHWIENPIKNQLIQSMMIDIALERGYGNIAIGDDASMSFTRPDFILGTNTTDCREVQSAFELCIDKILGRSIDFLMIDREIGSTTRHKGERIKLLADNGALECYYSCVGAGRFNNYNHKRSEQRFDIVLPKWNCGCFCAKCAMHNLLMHFQGIANYPKEFIEACWERLWKTKHCNISSLFSPKIPLDERIHNLFIY